MKKARAGRAFGLFAGFGFFGLVAIRFGLGCRLFRTRRAGGLRCIVGFRHILDLRRFWRAGFYRSGGCGLFDLCYQSSWRFKARGFAAEGFGAEGFGADRL